MVRFALGEVSLKSLRAKKTRDLIHTGAKAAEVTIYFEGDEKIEIKRAIRVDGKILYKLNGEKTTRSAIQNLLKKYNLDDSGRNIIAQGEVQRIINMGGKERRGIIDSVAGIADFEEKKKEAMKELDIVDVRIKDASLVLGERTAYLEDLAKERELAIKYKDSRKRLTEAKATLLKTEIKKIGHNFSEVSTNIEKLDFNIKNKETEMLEVNERITVVEEKRDERRKVLESKQKTSILIRKIEELKALLRSGTQLIEDRNVFLKKLEDDSLKLSKELEMCGSELPHLENSISDFRSEQKTFESQLSNLQMHESSESHKLREKLEAEEKSLHSIRENIVRIDTEISSKNELIQHKASMLSALSKDIGEFDSNSVDKEIAAMKRESSSVMREIEDYFSETKDCNKKIAEIDKQLLELKEKGSFLRVSISPALANPALRFIAELKSSGKVDGIYGLVGELIKFDQEYSNAVESAAGNRLLYVVVDNADTASKVIAMLKKSDVGRATFIPITEVKVSEPRPVAGFESLLKHVSFSNSVRRAIEFVFSDTTLVPKMADAKKNIGAGRMVTLEGEIFERSGVISGGRVASNILAGMRLKKLDEQLAQLKSEKESLINRLYSIREEESEKRSKKSKIDLEIRSLEIELQKQGEKKKEQEDLFKTKERLQFEINTVNDEIKSRHSEKDKLGSALVALEKQIAELNDSLSKSEQKYKEISDASNKRRTELTAKISSLKATIEGKMKELELKKREYYSTDERIKQLSKEKKDAVASINDAKRKLNEQNDELSKSESEMEKYSKDIEALFRALKEFDGQIQELGKSRGEVTIAIEKFNKDMNSLLVKKATFETRIQDLKVEYETYKDIPVNESISKEELTVTIKECEGALSQLGDVNLASIEKYEEKKKEVEDIRQKIDKLSEERTAILQVMSEIEDRKKEAFFSTFYAVSDNFQKMFKHISIGEGFLYLDNPNSPFDSGLFIKLKRYGREHTLDSLSGGENSLVALMFIFALQFFKPAPFYILDEVDAALDKENSKNLALLISEVSKTGGTQFIIVSHNDSVMSNAHAVLGVAKVDGASRIVGVKLEQLAKEA